MSSEKQTGESSKINESQQGPISTDTTGSQCSGPTVFKPVPESETHTTEGETVDESVEDQKKPAAKPDQPSDATSPSTPEDSRLRPRQVIAVSASKGPAAFFNLARKFLVTDEMCDLSALEGAIVSAADAAHLLERSRLATIVRVQTSYVTVEPKRKRQVPRTEEGGAPSPVTTQPGAEIQMPMHSDPSIQPSAAKSRSSGRELRRARIIITVQRTESYKRWLEENPLQAAIGADEDDEENAIHAAPTSEQLR